MSNIRTDRSGRASAGWRTSSDLNGIEATACLSSKGHGVACARGHRSNWRSLKARGGNRSSYVDGASPAGDSTKGGPGDGTSEERHASRLPGSGCRSLRSGCRRSFLESSSAIRARLRPASGSRSGSLAAARWPTTITSRSCSASATSRRWPCARSIGRGGNTPRDASRRHTPARLITRGAPRTATSAS